MGPNEGIEMPAALCEPIRIYSFEDLHNLGKRGEPFMQFLLSRTVPLLAINLDFQMLMRKTVEKSQKLGAARHQSHRADASECMDNLLARPSGRRQLQFVAE
jgi:hypothetical protein